MLRGSYIGSTVIGATQTFFLRPEDHFAYEVARAIDKGEKLSEAMYTADSQGLFAPTTEEWTTWFLDRPEWLRKEREYANKLYG